MNSPASEKQPAREFCPAPTPGPCSLAPPGASGSTPSWPGV